MSFPPTVGRYRIDRVLGTGAFASVWLAHDDTLNTPVAIKVLSGSLLDDLDVRNRFLEEARILRRADSDRLVRVHDIGELPDGRPYFVMSYADRGSLADRLAAGPPPVDQVLALAEEIAYGVETLHALGVIHRSLKPSNVLFQSTPDGHETVLIADLGLAKSLAHDTGAFTLPVGTPGYMSPEQSRFGGGLDVRADVYGLGALTYHMLTGQPPGPAPVTIPPSALRAGIEPRLDHIVLRAMEIDRERRWPSALAFAQALAAARTGDWSAAPDMEPATQPAYDTYEGWPETVMDSVYEPVEGWHADSELSGELRRLHASSPYPQSPYPDPGQPPSPQPFAQAQLPPQPLSPATSAYAPMPAQQQRAIQEPIADDVLAVPLRETFRYIHEPLPRKDGGVPGLGGQWLIESLKQRILHSHGGTFLISGFRGVGKTTLVMQALDELATEHPEGGRILPVMLSVARPMTTERLLFSIVRRVFETLDEAGILGRLPLQTQKALLLAYRRTSLSLKETLSDGTERGATVDLDLSSAARKVAPLAGIPLPKTTVSAKRTRALATETAYLNYSEHDAEYDMMRIIRMLSEGCAKPERRRRRFGSRRRRARAQSGRVHLVIVLDEVDKLTTGTPGFNQIENLLAGMKNVLTMRGVHYLVVAGPDLHDQVLKDSASGIGIYESIFAWQLYVPCNWRAPAKLVENGLRDQPDPELLSQLSDFDLYLRFKARGVPRRLLHEYNSFVTWREGKPVLRIRPQRDLRISFYARIQQVLEEYLGSSPRDAFPVQIDRDRYRLACYYIVDWILRSEGQPFSAADIESAIGEDDVDPLLRLSQGDLDALLSHLSVRSVIEAVRDAGVTSTLMPDVSESQLNSFKLSDETRERLWRMALASETERAELDFPAAPPPAGDVGVPMDVIGGRYEVRRFIGEGGTSSVYEGYDVVLRRRVAIKMLKQRLLNSAGATNRFLREARLTTGLHHTNLVETYQLVSRNDELAIVMELVEGELLSRRLRREGAMPPADAVGIAATLAEVLAYLSANDLVRLDIKPHNIVLHPRRGAVVIDLGLAKNLNDGPQSWQTQSGLLVGTPAYMAPEQIAGEPVDTRADIFGLGLVLYTCINGENPFERLPYEAAMQRIVDQDIDVSLLRISSGLADVLTGMLRRDREHRLSDPAAVRSALLATPEGGALNVHPAPDGSIQWATIELPAGATGGTDGADGPPAPDMTILDHGTGPSRAAIEAPERQQD